MTKRTQRSLIQAITSTYIWKNIWGLKSLNSTLNQLYLKKAPEEISDQHQKQRNIYHNLILFKTIFNYNVHPRGCTDSNVRIIYQVNRFFKQINLFKWYFSGPVNLEEKSWPVWKGHPPAWALLGKPTLISINNFAISLHYKKRKVGLALRETWLALEGYPFLIVGSSSEQGLLGWNNHCLLIKYVSLMLSDNIITLIRGNTK